MEGDDGMDRRALFPSSSSSSSSTPASGSDPSPRPATAKASPRETDGQRLRRHRLEAEQTRRAGSEGKVPVRVRRHVCVAHRDEQGRVLPPSSSAPRLQSAGEVCSQGSGARRSALLQRRRSAAVPAASRSDPAQSGQDHGPLLDAHSSAHRRVPAERTLFEEQRIAECQQREQYDEMEKWLAERRRLNDQLNTFGDAKTFIERNPPEFRTARDARVLAQLSEPVRRRTTRHSDTTGSAFDADWDESSDDEEQRALEARCRADQKSILRSMEAVNAQLRRHKYRIVAMLKRLDPRCTGRLSVADVRRVFSCRAFRVDERCLDVFLERLDAEGRGWVDYSRIVPLDDSPWPDCSLAEHWPELLGPSEQSLLTAGDLSPRRPPWGANPAAQRTTNQSVFGALQVRPGDEDIEDEADERRRRLEARVAAAPRAPARTQELRVEHQAQVTEEYKRIVAMCRQHGVVLDENLLHLLLVPCEDNPVAECIEALRQPGDLPPREELNSKINVQLHDMGFFAKNEAVKKRRAVFDTCFHYDNDHRVLPPVEMKLPTGTAAVGPKVDCWMTLDEYKRFTRDVKTRFRRPVDMKKDPRTEDKMSAFWPGFMLDRLRLWMPHTSAKSSPHHGNALLSGGSSYTQGALFAHAHRQPSLATAGQYLAKCTWPVNSGGHVQTGSVADKRRSSVL